MDAPLDGTTKGLGCALATAVTGPNKALGSVRSRRSIGCVSVLAGVEDVAARVLQKNAA
jgi:hypothetical protein